MLSLGIQYQPLILPRTENAGNILCLILLSSYYIGGHPLPTPPMRGPRGAGAGSYLSQSHKTKVHFLAYTSCHTLFLLIYFLLQITRTEKPSLQMHGYGPEAVLGVCDLWRTLRMSVRHRAASFYGFVSAAVRRQVFLAVAVAGTGLGPSHPHPLNGPFGTCRLRTSVLACWGVLHC